MTIPKEGDIVQTPDYGEGRVEFVRIPGTEHYHGPYYRQDNTLITDVPMLLVRTGTHRLRLYPLDELRPLQQQLL